VAHDSGWKWWLTFSFPPDSHRLHWHQLAWRTLNFLLDGYDLWRMGPHRQVRYASMY